MNKRELEGAIRDEVAEWPGVSVEFVNPTGRGHPKAKLTFGDLVMHRPYAATPSDSAFGLHNCLGAIRRVLRQMGAERAKPEPSKEETEKRYSKPNDGRDKRPDPVQREKAPIKTGIADQLADAGVVEADRVNVVANDVAPGSPAVVIVDAQTIKADEAAQRIREQAAAIIDGIYFGLPFEVYREVPRLSASGLQDLLVSPATFWKRSWLNPDRPALDEDATKAKTVGKAYHCARLEPDEFERRFAREPSKADYPAEGLLTSDAAIKSELKARDLTQTISGETIEDRAQRLLDDGFEGTIFPLIKAQWERELAGRTPIAADAYDDIVRDMQRIRARAEIAELLSDGAAEVSIFWTDRNGIQMKGRVDYLRAASWADLKSFDNTRGKVLAQALADNLRYYRLHVQAVTYREGIEEIRVKGLQIVGDATDDQRRLIAEIQMRPEPLSCWFIFQEKNGVPNLLGKRFPFLAVDAFTEAQIQAFAKDQDAAREAMMRKTGLFMRGMQDIDQAKRQFILYSQIYRPGREWAPIEPIGCFDDVEFSPKWLEGAYD